MTSQQPASQYSILRPLYMAFFSKALYQDVGRNWKGFGLVFIFSLVALCTIPFVLTAQLEFSNLLNREAPAIIKQMPSIRVTKGKVSIDKPEPYFVRDQRSGDPLIIFDTKGEFPSMTDSKAVLLVSRTSVIFRNNRGQTSVLDLSGYDGLYLDKRLLYEWMDELESSFALIFYPVAVMFSFLLRLIEIVVFGAIASLFMRTVGQSPYYRMYMRLAAISLTPGMVLGALLNTAGIALPFWWLISLPLAVAYFLFAVRVNRTA
jgi:hypothetical protein